MERVADSERLQQVSMPLWVVASGGGYWNCFELGGPPCRPIVIGSAPDADIRVVDPSLAPVQCYLQREGDEIWLFPVCSANVIRVDSVTVIRPMRLWRRCVVEVSGIAIDVRIREEPPTAPDHEVPTQRAESLHAPAATPGSVSNDRQPGALLGPRLLRPESGDRSPSVSGATGTEGLAAIPVSRIISVESSDGDVMRDPESYPDSATPLGNLRQATSAPAIGLWQAGHPAAPSAKIAEARADQAFRPLSAAERVARSRVGDSGRGAPLSYHNHDANEPPPSSTSPTVASVRDIAHGSAQRLEQLGILTRRRPWLVTLGAVLGAFAIAGTMHMGTRLAHLVRYSIEGSSSAAAAALLPTATPFCGPVRTPGATPPTEDTSRRTVCRWLPTFVSSSNTAQPTSPP
jgi:hypothetical protein